MRIRTRIASALVVLACLAGGQASAQPGYYAPVPPLRYEPPPPPPPPGARTVWQTGAWQWNGTGYVWLPGHYVVWHPLYRHWIPGHWAYRGPRPFWIPPHWG